MSKVGPCIIAHEKEPFRTWSMEELIPSGMDFMTPAFNRRAIRMRLKTYMSSLKDRWTGLTHPLHGHMNKHFLKMKYLRRKEGIELLGLAL